MNRTDRLLAIVLELQRQAPQRAEDLSATFEVSKRTIYRDITALSEAGVPLVAVPGLGYSLMEGYFLPPLNFTPDEATMLLLGADVMAQSFDAEYQLASEWAARKIEGVLPEKLREQVNVLRGGITFVQRPLKNDDEIERLRQLRRALIRQQTVRFVYRTRHPEHHEALNLREVDPYNIVSVGSVWYMQGYCHLRHDLRTFRLSRMDKLTVLPKSFERASTRLSIEQIEQMRYSRNILVRVWFDAESAPWVREERLFFISTLHEDDGSGGLFVTLKVRNLDEVLQWMMGWGSHARVLEPDELRQMMIREAEKILEQHRESLLT
jgi:predicted DNA-binding transcriptional regulator YafY